MTDWTKIKDDLSKNEMDFGQFRNETMRLIWNNDTDGLRQLCESQIITPLFFTEKVIAEIQPGNRWNDVLFLMARELIRTAPHVVGHLKSALLSKRHLVSHPEGGKELLEPLLIMELGPDEFLKRIEIVIGTVNFMGLDELVRENPNNTRAFISQGLDQNISLVKENPRTLQLLCEMAQSYQNHHHQSDLLELIKSKLGTLKFIRGEDNDVGKMVIATGTFSFHQLDDIARKAKTLFVKGNHSGAMKIYQDLIPKMNMLYASSIPLSSSAGGLSDDIPASMASEYENALMFYAVLLALEDKAVEAQSVFSKCAEKGYRYGDLLLFSVAHIKENKHLIDTAIRKVRADTAEKLDFDTSFKLVTGYSYLKANRMYDRFCRLVGDREVERAFQLSRELMDTYKSKRNKIVQFSLCEYLLHVFQACYLVLQRKTSEARQEYLRALKGQADSQELEQQFDNIARDPEQMLTHYFGN